MRSVLAIIVVLAVVAAIPLSKNKRRIQRFGSRAFGQGDCAFVVPANDLQQPLNFRKIQGRDILHKDNNNKIQEVGTKLAELIKHHEDHVEKPFTYILKTFEKAEVAEFQANPPVLIIPKLKGVDRAKEKIRVDYAQDLTRLVDVARATIVYKTLDEVKAGVCRFKTWLPKTFGADAQDEKRLYQCKIVRDTNRLTVDQPNGYSDFKINFQCVFQGIRTIVEVQFHVCSLLRAKSAKYDYLTELLPKANPNKYANEKQKNGHGLYKLEREATLANPLDRQIAVLQQAQLAFYTHALTAEQVATCENADAIKKWDVVVVADDDIVCTAHENAHCNVLYGADAANYDPALDDAAPNHHPKFAADNNKVLVE